MCLGHSIGNDYKNQIQKGGIVGIPQRQWLRLRAFTTMGWGSVPDQGTKIPQTAQRGKKKEGRG